MPEATSPSVPTNTIIITHLETSHMENTDFIARLRQKSDEFGKVLYFAPIKSFLRVFVVYESTFDAQRAKALMHNTAFEDANLRVYFGQHTDLTLEARHYLQPPELEKNWLISPPGSPPVGWTQIREDPPNAVHLADDLVKALLEMGQPLYQLPGPDGSKADRSHLFLSESDIEDFALDNQDDKLKIVQTTADQPEITTTHTSTPALATTTTTTATTPANAALSAPSANTLKEPTTSLQQKVRGLSIDTKPRQLSPRSPSSPQSALFPTTPTVLAFSPAREAEGEQPFITVQDWGVESEEDPRTTKLQRRVSIPKTMFPTGPVTHRTTVRPLDL
ncbi:carbohydrate-binding module 1 protein [Actinomortierella ambigua]|nr:carbohydrate-binding module 1 protein [Actinomortierella ambigua]